jgi:hypothetical protein
VLAAGVAERVADRRRPLEERSRALVLDVEDAQRARRELLTGLLPQLAAVLFEPCGQLRDVGGPALAAADRVQLEPVPRDPEAAEKRVEVGTELDALERGNWEALSRAVTDDRLPTGESSTEGGFAWRST